jgi:hypothetical protein
MTIQTIPVRAENKCVFTAPTPHLGTLKNFALIDKQIRRNILEKSLPVHQTAIPPWLKPKIRVQFWDSIIQDREVF